MAGNGWCSHPRRQTHTDAILLVRAAELACRNDWGGDLFQSRHSTEPEVPAAADQADLPAAQRDDEVTSVVTRLSDDQHDTPVEDRVVSNHPTPQRSSDEDDSWNDDAHEEQLERARLLARGDRDALMSARKRFSSRRGAGDPAPEEADESERVVTHQERFTDRRFRQDPTHFADPVPRSEVASRQPVSRRSTGDVDLPGDHRTFEQDPPAADDRQPDADTSEHTPYLSVAERARRARRERHRPVRRARRSPRQYDSADTEAAGPPPRAEASAAPSDEPPASANHDDRTTERPVIERETYVPSDDAEVAEHVSIEAEVDAPAADETGEPLAPWPDDDEIVAHAAWDDDPFADEPDPEPLYDEPEPRPARGWLSRFNLTRRQPAAAYDDSMVTRHHLAADDGVDREDPDQPWTDEPYEDDVEYDNTPRYRHHFDETDMAPIPAPVPSEDRGPEPMHRQRLAPALPDLDDDLFDQEFERRPEPAATRAFDRERRWLREPDSAPATESLTTESRHAEPEPAPARPVAAPEPGTDSPRESFFRASRYRDWDDESHASVDAAAMEHDLPDIAEAGFDLREVVARGGELLDMTIDIAPDVPRECRTCRSFRSADGGTRGWCTNEFAFTHRRMVNEDDLACDTTIGCWWLPADRYWLIEPRDGYAATPRIDALIERRRRYHEPEIEREGASG